MNASTKTSSKLDAKRRESQSPKVIEKFVKNHAPTNMSADVAVRVIKKHLDDSRPMNAIILCGDIRKSSFLMKEAYSPDEFARILGDFFDDVRKVVRGNGGWFEKFTGDGFLAFWHIDSGGLASEKNPIFDVCHQLLASFKKDAMPAFRENSINFPDGVGLSFGLDMGECHLVNIVGSLTIIGSPVVGAVRMESAAERWETLCNVFLGEVLMSDRGEWQDEGVFITQKFCGTKEYPKTESSRGQEVYSIHFGDDFGKNST